MLAAPSVSLPSKNGSLTLIRVPEHVAASWLKEAPGTVVGMLKAPQGSRKGTIALPDSSPFPVKRIHSAIVKEAQVTQQLVLQMTGTSDMPLKARYPCIEGTVRASESYLPDVTNPSYRAWLIEQSSSSGGKKKRGGGNGRGGTEEGEKVPLKPRVLSVEETAAFYSKHVEDTSSATSGSRLFHYFSGEGGGDNDSPSASQSGNAGGWGGATSTTAGVSSDEDGGSGLGAPSRKQRRRQGQAMSTEEAQARLFKFFEAKGGEGANMREICAHLGGGVTQSAVKQILDVVAEPRRERQGKRVLFVLKPEFGGRAN